mmetsp:Transcript_129604/g.415606  ORF Transcript_129604/g.415606 Transcript_129604/m.415606 type:complete len:386 (-) Transcript_129604:107-1264(-)
MDAQGADHRGGCASDHKSACSKSVQFYGFTIEDIGAPRVPLPASPPSQPAKPAPAPSMTPAPTSAPRPKPGPSQSAPLQKPGPSKSAPMPKPGGPSHSLAIPPLGALDLSTKDSGMYEFIGYASSGEARDACGPASQLAMPKTQTQQVNFLQALSVAQQDGHVGAWPHDSVWVAGHYSSHHKTREWDDGTPILGLAWGENQPSAKGHQHDEPWLCIENNRVHYCPGMRDGKPLRFAVCCEHRLADAVEKPAEISVDESEADFCCDHGEQCGTGCRRKSMPLSYCGRSRANCEEACFKVWCLSEKSANPVQWASELLMRTEASPIFDERAPAGRATATGLGVMLAMASASMALVACSVARIARRTQATPVLYEHVADQRLTEDLEA